MSVLVVMSPNTVTTDLDNEMVRWENVGKEKTEGGKKISKTLAWLQALWHWCQAVVEVLLVPLVYSDSPGRAAARLLPSCVGKNVHRKNLCKPGNCHTSIG